MFRIGCHISAEGGYLMMAKRAYSLGANTFAFFTRNPRGGASKAIREEDIEEFRSFCKTHGIDRIVAHAPYTLNPCAEKPNVLDFAHLVFREDLERMEHTPGQYYNFHPGSHVGQGIHAGIEKVSNILNEHLWPEMTTTVLLETMAGKGSEVGGTFEEIRQILQEVDRKEKVGVCLDTCHIWDGGYDIENELETVLEQFDRTVGIGRLKAIHLNNSMNSCGSRKDRHAKITQGMISMDAIVRIITHPCLQGLPFILETPNDYAGYAEEITLLRNIHEKGCCL